MRGVGFKRFKKHQPETVVFVKRMIILKNFVQTCYYDVKLVIITWGF